MSAHIEHVVVLALENRSFDHMLGFVEHPDPAFDGLLHGGPYLNPGTGRGETSAGRASGLIDAPPGPAWCSR